MPKRARSASTTGIIKIARDVYMSNEIREAPGSHTKRPVIIFYYVERLAHIKPPFDHFSCNFQR